MTIRDTTSKPDLERQFRSLRKWKEGPTRAPQKPLLVVWMIGRCIAGKERLVSYGEADRELRRLWSRFGPPRGIHTEQPFWRLRNDNVWEVPEAHLIEETASKDAKIGSLREHNARGGFTKVIFDELRKDKERALRIALELVDEHFPDTLQNEVLEAAGVEAEYVMSRRRARDPSFRPRVLEAYGYRCAVCELSIFMVDSPIALEAAHIKWHEANGPDEVRNGLSLCNLHHRLFDDGAFTAQEGTVQVSRLVEGHGMEDVLGQYATKPLLTPTLVLDTPAPAFVAWHRKEVFKDQAP